MKWLHHLVHEAQLAEISDKFDAIAEAMSRPSPVGKGDELLTSKQVAPLLGVTHHKTVERWVRERGLPCVRIGRNLRFRQSDVLRWQAHQEH